MLGLKNLSIAGRGGSSAWWDKMWSSYTQLNPGVYSEAIATEFKRRMKPDYVENLVPNGGGLNATDWLGAVGGAAQGFTFNNVTPTIVTGSGFTGNAQRIVATTTVASFSKTIPVETGKSYNVSFKYRASAGISLRLGSDTTYPTNTGDAILVSFTSTVGATLAFGIYPRTPGGSVVGDWVEVDELTISPVVSVNYFTTFGPSGLNKQSADWILLLTTGGDIISRTITKSGDVLKWNLDGTIVTQNNLPAYTKGIKAGIVTTTSTDGWSGVTTLFLFTNTFSGYIPNLSQMVNLITFSSSVNMFTNVSGDFGNTAMSTDDEKNNAYSTSQVNSRLAYYNSMFGLTPPIKNFTLNLNGATMGIPTGAGSNPDYLGIIAKVQAAGFIPSVTIRTT